MPGRVAHSPGLLVQTYLGYKAIKSKNTHLHYVNKTRMEISLFLLSRRFGPAFDGVGLWYRSYSTA